MNSVCPARSRARSREADETGRARRRPFSVWNGPPGRLFGNSARARSGFPSHSRRGGGRRPGYRPDSAPSGAERRLSAGRARHGTARGREENTPPRAPLHPDPVRCRPARTPAPSPPPVPAPYAAGAARVAAPPAGARLLICVFDPGQPCRPAVWRTAPRPQLKASGAAASGQPDESRTGPARPGLMGSWHGESGARGFRAAAGPAFGLPRAVCSRVCG